MDLLPKIVGLDSVGVKKPDIGASVIPHDALVRYDVDKGLRAVERILNSTDAEFESRAFILDFIRQ